VSSHSSHWEDQIDVLLTDESGAVLDALTGGGRELVRALPSKDDPDFPYLRFIDWLDTTTFTRAQMGGVVPELRRLSRLKPSPVVDRILALAERCEQTTHSRLVFSGV
jgi:hypothetical protein